MQAPPPITVPPQLAGHRVFGTADIDEACEEVGRVFCDHSLRLVNKGDRLWAEQYAANVGDVTISHLSYGAEVEIDAGPATSFFSVQLPVGGQAEVRCGAQRIVSTPSVASVPTPVERLRMRWARDAAHVIVKVDEAVLERELARLLGHPPPEPLRLVLGLDVASGHGARWRAIHTLLLSELALAQEGRSTPASRAVVQELVIGSLLLTHPSNYLERLQRGGSLAGPRYVRRAMEHARERLDGPLTLGELAVAAGVSARALQDGFRATVGRSPMSWVRDQRLDRAHAELTAAEPGDGTRVTDVALHWGFAHFGRFAQLYARRFGERPSETLRR